MEEPLQRLRVAAAAAGVSDRLTVLEEGKTKIFR
jgi:hypothetical protein